MSSILPSNKKVIHQENIQQNKMETYYRFQSRIYDATRWSFLFGRKSLISKLPELSHDATILEVGCGTGYNLRLLENRFPGSRIIGLDISENMLKKARRKIGNHSSISLMEGAYGAKNHQKIDADMVLFSYSLSMINPHWSALIDQAYEDLKPGAYIGVVDFEYSKVSWFQQHMSKHHVRMEKHLIPYLNKKFQQIEQNSKSAYGGLWNYFQYIGQKK